jgi:hypothetical protein
MSAKRAEIFNSDRGLLKIFFRRRQIDKFLFLSSKADINKDFSHVIGFIEPVTWEKSLLMSVLLDRNRDISICFVQKKIFK